MTPDRPDADPHDDAAPRAVPWLNSASFWSPELVTPSAWLQHAPFAYWLMSALEPRVLVELGTHRGFSYFAFCQAVKRLGLGTRCYAVDTWKGDEHAGFYGEEVFKAVQAHNEAHYSAFSRLVRSTFDEALAHFPDGTVDLLHIDGRHYYDDVKHDFQSWRPKLSDRAVVLFHDTNVRERDFGVHRLWAELAGAHPSFEFLHGHGLGVLAHGPLRAPMVADFLAAMRDARNATHVRNAYARLGSAVSAAHEASRAKEDLAAKLAREAERARETERQLADARRTLSELTEKAAAKEREIAGARQALTGRDAEVNRLKSALNQSLAERDAARSQQDRVQDLLDATYGSTSWRLTFPLRGAKTVLTLLHKVTSAAFRSARNGQLSLAAIADGIRQHAAPAGKADGLPGGTSISRLMNAFTPDEVARIQAAFDPDFYARNNPDVVTSGRDPFEHFMKHGWREGRDPSPHFSVSYYLRRYPDIQRARVNPLIHYVLHGRKERRASLPYQKRLDRADFLPKVVAIVPNYNHERFLERRLDSILKQSYTNLEVLILDDCSTDGSHAIIDKYCRREPDRVRALFNDSNSGNVFKQWRKGVENTDSDLLWVCESDDFCEDDFLEKLVPFFRDRSINIAFGRIQFCNADGEFQAGLDAYREGAEPGIWKDPLVRPAREWFSNGFGVNNVIANVGGCIWRRTTLPASVWQEAETFSVVGDWFLYCHLAGGGQIAYQPSAVAYFRQHATNTSVSSFVEARYYTEHHRLMRLLHKTWDVPKETVERFQAKVAFQHRHHKLEETLGPLERYLDIKELLNLPRERQHILMAFLGFHPGGGEVFPINLANELHAQGHIVSMLALDTSYANAQMLASLAPGIPVYDAEWVEEHGADRFLAEAGVTVIHSHMVSVDRFFFERCNIQAAIPYLVTLHGSHDAVNLDETAMSRIAARVSHFVYLTDRNLSPFQGRSYSEDKFTSMANAVPLDPRPFPKTRQELGISEDAVVFTLVARGIEKKGWGVAIKAFRQLRDQRPERDMHLLLAGEGEETEKQARIHGGDPDITFLGFQPRIVGLYRISDCAIVPTRSDGESFPLCILEAMQAGTPVVATRIGEIERMIVRPEGTAGLLIEYERDTALFADHLRAAMERMLDPSERRRFGADSAKLGSRYSMAVLAQDYATLYGKLTGIRVRPTAQQRLAWVAPESVAATARLQLYRNPLVLGVGAARPLNSNLPVDAIVASLGKNTGNILFSEAAFRSIENARRSDYSIRPSDVEGRDCIVIAAANWLSQYTDFGSLAEKLERFKLPTVIVGIGAQADRETGVPDISAGTLRLMKFISETSAEISARGEYTCEVLNHYGIKNVRATGCPSLLLIGGGEPVVKQSDTLANENVVIHSTRHSFNHCSPLQAYLYRQALANRHGLVLQSELADMHCIVSDTLDDTTRAQCDRVLSDVYGVSAAEAGSYLKANGQVFFGLEDWLEYLRAKDFCLGTRIHGTIAALLAEVPAALITHDSRTAEMARAMAIPYFSASNLDTTKPLNVEEFYDKDQLQKFVAGYSTYSRRFMDFFAKNGIPTRLATEYQRRLSVHA
jgi:glycosyltransferase involved in cell wall biosynthesis/GT2 family glycosyltransferase